MRLTVGTRNDSDRADWVVKTLKGIPAGWRILDAGAGELRYKKYCSHLAYVSQDFAQYDGSGDNKGMQTGKWDQTKLDIVCDIASIPEPDGSFDAILCVEVFEHLPDPLLALKEFSRLLKKGGILILTAPFCSITHFAPFHFATGFNRYFYETHLPKAGLTIQEMSANGNYFEFVGQEVRRIKEVASKYSTTPVNVYEKVAIKIVLALLQRLSASGQQSSELLNFGFHVKAVKGDAVAFDRSKM